MKLDAAPLSLRPEVKTPGEFIETPSFAPAASAPETEKVMSMGRKTLLALPSVSTFPLTIGAPETLRVPPSTNTPLPNSASLPLTLPPERVKLLPSETNTPPPPYCALLPATLPPERVKLPPPWTNTPPPLAPYPPVIFPLPTRFSAVALESVTVRRPPLSIRMTEPFISTVSRSPLLTVKPFRSSVTVPTHVRLPRSKLPPPVPYFTLSVSL